MPRRATLRPDDDGSPYRQESKGKSARKSGVKTGREPVDTPIAIVVAVDGRPESEEELHRRLAREEAQRRQVQPDTRRKEKPARDVTDVDGPMSKASVHQTESRVDHPMGKSRHGVGQRRGN